MADDKSKTDGRDRSQVAGREPYEVQYFAEKLEITIEQARRLIQMHGNDRQTLERAAASLKARE